MGQIIRVDKENLIERISKIETIRYNLKGLLRQRNILQVRKAKIQNKLDSINEKLQMLDS